MASRQTAGTTSANQYAGGQASSQQQGDINLSSNPAIQLSSAIVTALVGTTIGGQTVGPLEIWADGAVWDTTNSRYLRPGSDFDITLLHRSGFGG